MSTDFRALCAELLDELELWSSWHDATDLKDRAGAALHFTQPEPQPPAAIVEMVNKLHQINNPAPLAQPETVAPTDGEVTELVAWLRQFADAKKGYRRGTTAAALALKVTRAANLLERLASDNAGLAAAADSLHADNMSLLDSYCD